MKKAMVTGANGHLGANLCRTLLDRGVRVVALTRPGSDRRGLEGVEVEVAEGDILDYASVRDAVDGCDTVFHAACPFAIWVRDAEELLRPAVEGTEHVLRAADAMGAQRVVLTSSVSAVGASDSPERLLDAEHWAPELRVPYYIAKQRAERRAWELAEELSVSVVSTLPTLMIGPHDHRITPSTRMVLDMLNGTGASIDGGGNVIDVRDAAEAHVLAAERGRPGQRYILGGDNLTTRELATLVSALTGRPVKHIGAPRWVLSAVAGIMELGASVSGKAPPMTRAAVRDLVGKYAWYDLSKTTADLRFRPAGAADAVAATARWLLDEGHLKPAVAEAVRERLDDRGVRRTAEAA